MCEETKCDWKCKKPTLCPKPKCELVCEKVACAEQEPQCCPCTAETIGIAVANANAAAAALGSTVAKAPSFLEISHSMKFKEQAGQPLCCPCAAGAAPAAATTTATATATVARF